MAQQVEHVLGKDEVTGSSPVSSSIKVLPSEEPFSFYKTPRVFTALAANSFIDYFNAFF